MLIGGTADEQLGGMSVDAEGQVWLAVQTGSCDVPGLPQPAPLLAFAAKLSAAGDRLTAVVPIGGPSSVPYSVVTGRRGELYIGGRTSTRDMPATPGAVGSTASPAESIRGFVVKLDTLGQELWRALLGGSRADEVAGLAFGPNGEILATGAARSADFPTTADAWIRTGSPDRPHAFIAALSYDGSRLLHSTLIDGTDQLRHVRVDAEGNVYAATSSGPFHLLKLSPGLRSLAHRVVNQRSSFVSAMELGDGGTAFLIGTAAAGFPTRNSLAFCAWNMPNRAERGSVISLFLTGAGVLRPMPEDGSIGRAPLGHIVSDCRATLVEFVRRPCLFGTCPPTAVPHPVDLLYAGAAPGLISGVTQINVRLPVELHSTVETSVEFTIRDAPAAAVRVWVG